jgi:hypothetical protein
MYCQGCQTFASSGDPEVEIDSYDDSTDSAASVEITIRIPCGGCGGEFKEGTLSTSVDVEGAHASDECTTTDDKGAVLSWANDYEKITELRGEREFEIFNEPEVTVEDDYRPKTRTLKKLGPDGKPLEVPVPRRAQRRYYDAIVTVSAKCSICEAEFDATVEDSIGAGELEEVG